MPKKADLLITPLGEGGLLLVVAAIGWATWQPLVFASLGPTIYELVEQPQQQSAKTYNVIAGHFVGIGAGYLGLWAAHAWSSPAVMSSKFVPGARLWAAVIAVVVTTFVTLLIRARQPASLATSLLIALGSMQRPWDALILAAGVVVVAIMGEPVRLLRLRQLKQQQAMQNGTG
jgi:CBS domain-containing membrane protein